ncbi:hypothetical protein AJ80_08696 [Polytolypa hystricis UAMH7299]|uniref:Aminoglycoside phosphotransferase domain-containing protein n=1 Tax=Polytolypa hystricis (strain UAMH7299) TaxID=1447883 RepID=A0A2B7X2Q6_POLH7|nr:hypothetical protein AJ80_08696 [Polytolypa hystricis UAMH7299]
MEMKYDDEAWEQSDRIFELFKRKASSGVVLEGVTEFMASRRPSVRPIDRARIFGVGAFNFCYRMQFEDGFSSILRFASPGRSMFPAEKTRAEVAVMRFIKQNTTIPVPDILDYGMHGPCDMGPYILMECVDCASNLTAVLRAPGYKRGDRPYLDRNIEEKKLELLYGQVADILLELSRHDFGKIGCLTLEAQPNGWPVVKRPLSMNMNELVQLGNYPRHRLPSSPFTSASSYLQSLAETHFIHLSTQRNDAVESREDCRRKYIARRLLCRLASNSALSQEDTFDTGRFKLFCDDLRPTNILIDDSLRIVAVIDWEFTYAAPAEFTYSPPWWLLLETPEDWNWGVSDWAATYESRLKTFLKAMKTREDSAIREGMISEHQRLSIRMQDSWDNGSFWVNYGLRKSWAFDMVWPYIDRKFFGGNGTDERRIDLLDSGQRLRLLTDGDFRGMDEFVQRKLEDGKTRALDPHVEEETEDSLSNHTYKN